MIRKYFSGLLAAFLAVAMVAFTPSEKEPALQSTSTFYFVPPGGSDFTEDAVEDIDNWTTAPSSTPSCSGANKACRIVVSNSNIDENGKLNFELNAMQGENQVEEEYVPDQLNTPEIISQVDRS